MPLRELANDRALRDYLAHQSHARGRSDHTLRLYEAVLTELVDHCGSTPFARVQSAWLQAFVDRSDHAASTRARDVSIVRSLYSWLEAHGELDGRNPSRLLAAPKHSRKNPKAISDSVWAKVWAKRLDPDDRVVLGLGMFLGIRREEMCRLRPAHVDADRGLLVAFTRKGGGDDTMPYRDLFDLWGSRMPQLGIEAFELEAYADKRRGHDWLLPWGEYVNPRYRDARLAIALPEGQTHPNTINARLSRHVRAPFAPHALRHSFVTNLLRAGVELSLVTELANHSSPSVTWRYVRTGGGRLAEWMAHH